MPPDRLALARIDRLRALFCDESRADRALGDYWRDDGDLAAYDAVLAPRIGWKWDAALAECLRRGWPPTATEVLDYGCGTGIASRRYLAHCRAASVRLHDRSPRAMAFAAASLRAAAPGVDVRTVADPASVAPQVVLVSHVLGELDARGAGELEHLLARCEAVVVVEPGSKAVARRLSALRDSLRASFRVLAPCTHAGDCPALRDPEDWCHFFAPPPPEVFTDGEFVRTARAVGIDLRSLPYAFVAALRGGPAIADPDAGRARLLGRPHVASHTATVSLCSASGRREHVVQRRHEPDLWRRLKKDPSAVTALPVDDGGTPPASH